MHDNIRLIAADNHLQRFDATPAKRLDVLMETGTGKTFTYLQTIFEIHKRFAQNKFIIVLPRTAIKLGVIQNIKLTQRYFFNEYKLHLNYIDYPKDGLNRIRKDFIESEDLQVLIITNSAFNSKKNTINQTDETLVQYPSTWRGMAEQRPVVIIDEPHLLKGSRTSEYLAQLDSLFIRFGATFPETDGHKLSNVVYALDSIASFNQYLVKRIGVSTIYADAEADDVSFHNFKAKNSFDICYSINAQPQRRTVYLQQDIAGCTGLVRYTGISAVKISSEKIFLSSGRTVEAPKGAYTLNDVEMTQMIRHAIELHFAKEFLLFQRGVKALTLLFIPGIQDFRGDNPTVKNIFEREYRLVRDKIYANCRHEGYRQYLDMDYADGKLQVHEGYFSGDKGSVDDKESAGVNLILNEKEKLLSFSTPLRFIFSVWALQEGWDNPNVFTICKLASTAADTSRRQQVGRGLRVAVNQSGKRLTLRYFDQNAGDFFDVNTLDMVVSRREQEFIGQIQKEITESSFSISGDILTFEMLTQKGFSPNEITLLTNILQTNKITEFDNLANNWRVRSPIPAFINSHEDRFLSQGITPDRLNLLKTIFLVNSHAQIRDNNVGVKTTNARRSHWRQFQILWETINKKSRLVYRGINQEELIDEIATQFNGANVPTAEIRIVDQVYNSHTNTVSRRERTGRGSKFFVHQNLSAFITEFARDLSIPLAFTVRLFNKLNQDFILKNPRVSLDLLRNSIQACVHKCVIQCVSYEFCEKSVYANSLQDERGELIAKTPIHKIGKSSDATKLPVHFVFEQVVWDSIIEKDSIINGSHQVNDHKITVFAKLPAINIPTSFKVYNPDFAYLIESRGRPEKLFLVVESKGDKHESEITEDEKQKTRYARKFFLAMQKQLPSVRVAYEQRANAHKLFQLVQGITRD